MTPQETFITRLRRHRERNRVSLEEVANHTRIKREQLEAFERGDLDAWPRGIYAPQPHGSAAVPVPLARRITNSSPAIKLLPRCRRHAVASEHHPCAHGQTWRS